MEQNKFLELLSDPEFMKKLVVKEKVEDVQKLFRDEGIELSEEEVKKLANIVVLTAEKGGKLTDADIESISGGSLLSDVIKGCTAGACCGAMGGALYGTGQAVDKMKPFKTVGRVRAKRDFDTQCKIVGNYATPNALKGGGIGALVGGALGGISHIVKKIKSK